MQHNRTTAERKKEKHAVEHRIERAEMKGNCVGGGRLASVDCAHTDEGYPHQMPIVSIKCGDGRERECVREWYGGTHTQATLLLLLLLCTRSQKGSGEEVGWH